MTGTATRRAGPQGRGALAIAGVLAAGTAAAGAPERLPVANICAGVNTFWLLAAAPPADGWARGFVVAGYGMSAPPDAAGPVLLWDARCADGLLFEAGSAPDMAAAEALAAATPLGTGARPDLRCAGKDTLVGAAGAICARAAALAPTDGN